MRTLTLILRVRISRLNRLSLTIRVYWRIGARRSRGPLRRARSTLRRRGV